MPNDQSFTDFEQTGNVSASADMRAMLGNLMPYIGALAPDANIMLVKTSDLHPEIENYD